MSTRKFLNCLLFILVVSACNPKIMDDFFGIQMEAQYADKFEIVSYSPETGAKYKSNMYMDPSVYAYAEFGTKTIHLKIGNFSDRPIEMNYNLDKFYLYIDNDKFFLSPGKREKYDTKKIINIKEFIEFDLHLPLNLLDTVGKTNPQSMGKDRPIEYWDGQTTSHILKQNVKYIELNFGTNITIILKPIP